MLKKLELEEQIDLVKGIFGKSDWKRLDKETTKDELVFWPIINKKENRLALEQCEGCIVEIDVEKININVCDKRDLRRFLNFFKNELPPMGVPFIRIYLLRVVRTAQDLIDAFANSASAVAMKN